MECKQPYVSQRQIIDDNGTPWTQFLPQEVKAGETVSLTVRALDESNNLLFPFKKNGVMIKNSKHSLIDFEWKENHTTQLVTIEFAPKVSGTYELYGFASNDLPWTFTVTPAQLSSSYSRVNINYPVNTQQSFTAGESVQIQIVPYDQFGN